MTSSDVESSKSTKTTLSPTPTGKNPFDDASIRRHFISKVFALLTVMLALAFSIMAFFIFVKSAKEWMLDNGMAVSFVATGVYSFVSFILICCSSSVGRLVPCNYILLAIFTVSISFVFTPFVILYDLEAVLLSLGTTVVLVVTVAALSVCTSFDFTRWLCVLNLTIFGFCLTSLVTFAVSLFTGAPPKWLVLGQACAGVVLFTLSLAMEVQMIVGGRRFSYSPEDYVLATINIFLDIIYIFIYLLQIIGSSRS